MVWLAAQAGSGYVDYDSSSGRFAMNPEQAMALASESSPVYVAGAFEVAAKVEALRQKDRDFNTVLNNLTEALR